jgi:hypothetical protein
VSLLASGCKIKRDTAGRLALAGFGTLGYHHRPKGASAMSAIPLRCFKLWILGSIILIAPSARAEEKDRLPVERCVNDRQIIDLLASVHDRGAAMYNAGDYYGCFRLFEGSLLTIKPLLPGEIQHKIAVGIPDAERQPVPARRAMLMHDLMEMVRVSLRPTAGPAAEQLKAPRPTLPGRENEPMKKAKPEAEIPPPPIKLPTLGTPTKGTLPGETAEPLLAPIDDGKTNGKVSGPDSSGTIKFDDPKLVPLPSTKDDAKSAAGAKDQNKPAQTPPLTIPTNNQAPTSPAPPSTKPKDDGKPPDVPPIVIPIPDGK